MRNLTTVVCIVVYTGCAITACTTYPAHAGASEDATQMDMQDEFEQRQFGTDKQSQRMQRLEDELQRVRDQLYYMREQRNQVPCGNCAFR